MNFSPEPSLQNSPLPLDSLLLMVLILPFLAYDEIVAAFIVLLVVIYVLLGLRIPFRQRGSEAESDRREQFDFILKLFLLLLIIALVILFPTIYYMRIRPNEEPEAHLHDGAYQTEVALKFLTRGKNPYAESYVGTGVERYTLPGTAENPAAYHFVYFPFLLWVSLPLYLLSTALFHWYDQRIVYLISFVVMLFLLTRMTNDHRKKLILLILVALNAYTSDFIQYGFNDVLIFTLLLAVILLLRSNRLTLASVLLGLACATKPSAWFMIPFVSLFVSGSFSPKPNLSLWMTQMRGFWGALLLALGPFVLWNAEALYRSTIAYTLGIEGTGLYPIRGYGIGTWLLATGIIPSASSQFPFWILQLLAAVPVLLLMLHQQQFNNTINRMLFGYAVFLFALIFFSRFFQGNYLHFILLIVFLAWLIDPFQLRARSQPAEVYAKLEQ